MGKEIHAVNTNMIERIDFKEEGYRLYALDIYLISGYVIRRRLHSPEFYRESGDIDALENNLEFITTIIANVHLSPLLKDKLLRLKDGYSRVLVELRRRR